MKTIFESFMRGVFGENVNLSKMTTLSGYVSDEYRIASVEDCYRVYQALQTETNKPVDLMTVFDKYMLTQFKQNLKQRAYTWDDMASSFYYGTFQSKPQKKELPAIDQSPESGGWSISDLPEKNQEDITRETLAQEIESQLHKSNNSLFRSGLKIAAGIVRNGLEEETEAVKCVDAACTVGQPQSVYKQGTTLSEMILDGISRDFENSQIIAEAASAGFAIDESVVATMRKSFEDKMHSQLIKKDTASTTPDYWVSEQHGRLLIARDEPQDPAYKWAPVALINCPTQEGEAETLESYKNAFDLVASALKVIDAALNGDNRTKDSSLLDIASQLDGMERDVAKGLLARLAKH